MASEIPAWVVGRHRPIIMLVAPVSYAHHLSLAKLDSSSTRTTVNLRFLTPTITLYVLFFGAETDEASTEYNV